MSSARPIEKIVVLGGGTAGWMAATFIQRALEQAKHRCHITVIASEEIGTVGVGEATIPTIHKTLRYLGLEPKDWMKECTSTYKLAVRFINWNKSGKEYWHPFGPLTLGTTPTEALNYWLRARQDGETDEFVPLFFPSYHLANAGSIERISETEVSRAYHLDATLLGRLLKRVAIERGIQYRSDEIVSVNMTEAGFIKSLITKNGEEIEGDLFVDCSGFRSVLMQGVFKEPFESYGDHLICDRAIALSSKVTVDKQVQVTTATALSAGWSWHIPLTTRNGIGYVYSSKHISPDDAEKEIRQLAGPAADSYESRHIKMRIGKSRRTWVKNCVAIGLSGGFIEPLESTGIFLIETGVRSLMMFFPDSTCDEALAKKYNDEMTSYYEEIRDFITLHYVGSQRTDTSFWRDASNEKRMTERLRECLEEWKECALAPILARNDRLFPFFSWICIFLGSDILPPGPIPFFAGMDRSKVSDVIDRARFFADRAAFQQ